MWTSWPDNGHNLTCTLSAIIPGNYIKKIKNQMLKCFVLVFLWFFFLFSNEDFRCLTYNIITDIWFEHVYSKKHSSWIRTPNTGNSRVSIHRKRETDKLMLGRKTIQKRVRLRKLQLVPIKTLHSLHTNIRVINENFDTNLVCTIVTRD